MAKSLDDLGDLHQPVGSDLDQARKDAASFVQRCEDLEADCRFSFAYDTIYDIRKTVEETQRVSEGQRQAIDNIEQAGTARDERRSKRRYEGWSGRGR